MKWKFKRLLLKILLAILALYIAATTYKAYIYDYKEIEPVKIIKQHEQIGDSHFIISEEMILGKIQEESQIVSVKQDFDKKDTKVDDSFLGERKTELKLHGTYKLGLETKEVEIKHIDQENGNVYIALPSPKLISLEIPFDKIDIDKTKGWFRMAMSEEEQKTFYRAVHKNIEQEILNDKGIMSQTNLNNQRVIKDLLINLYGINDIIFSEEEQL